MSRTARATLRHLVEQTPTIDIRRLKRDGHIGPDDAVVTLRTVPDGQSYMVRIAHLERPVFGGVRSHFLCPACNRRCDLLYLRPNLACRVCHRLAYASENEVREARARRRLFKRRERLGQREGGVVAPFPAKPKWWRWPLYLRIRRQGMQEEREYWQAFYAAMVKGKYTDRPG
jgi:hypothetical protein